MRVVDSLGDVVSHGRIAHKGGSALSLEVYMPDMHIACMSKSVTIRNVPNSTGDELMARAARSGRSLQEYLRAQLILLAERPDPEALMARIRERKDRMGSRMAVESIIAHRDADRR